MHVSIFHVPGSKELGRAAGGQLVAEPGGEQARDPNLRNLKKSGALEKDGESCRKPRLAGSTGREQGFENHVKEFGSRGANY